MIYARKTIDGRPFFTESALIRPKTSILNKNPLLNRLKPVKNRSKILDYFKRFTSKVSSYFVVKHPSAVKENISKTIRPVEGKTPLTVGNLWHYYEHFIKEDRDCPPGLKSCFKKMEKDEKEIFKLSNHKKARPLFITKKMDEIKRMPVGSSQLLLLQRDSALDQSINGHLFCTINRTKEGYTLHFIGSDFQQESLSLAGKDKVLRSLTYSVEDSASFNHLIEGWVNQSSADPLKLITDDFKLQPKVALDDYTTRSNRPDKLFWNIVLSLPQKKSDENTRESVRALRLRIELLTLYETFEESRNHLDPKSKEYRDLKKLHADVSAKVLLSYRKKHLSKSDFRNIKNKLTIIDTALQSAKKAHSKNIPTKIALKEPRLDNVSLQKAFIQNPLPATATLSSKNVDLAQEVENKKTVLELNKSIVLNTYSSIDTVDAFMNALNSIDSPSDFLRFFTEVPLNMTHYGETYTKNDDSFWWKFSPDEAQNALEKISELQVLPAPQFSYESNALDRLTFFNSFLKACATNTWEVPASDHRIHNRHHEFYKNHQFLEFCKGCFQSSIGAVKYPYKTGDRNIWLRPLENPYLKGIHNTNNTGYFGNVLEQTFDQPKETFEHYKQTVLSAHGYIDSNHLDAPWSEDEIKALSRINRNLFRYPELLAFMRESSHLLLDPEVRSYFDTLFFEGSFAETEFDPILDEITVQIERLNEQLNEQLKRKRIEDPELLSTRFDHLLYSYEMVIKLKEFSLWTGKPIDRFQDLDKSLEYVNAACREIPELKRSIGYASRLLLREQWTNEGISKERFNDIISTFADAHSFTILPANTDPYFEREMAYHWELILNQLEGMDIEDLTPLLNRICNNQSIPSEEEWIEKESFIYRNGPYELNLKNFKVSLIDAPVALQKLPSSIFTNPFISSLLKEEDLEKLHVLAEDNGSFKIYSFTDVKGVPTQIQEGNGQIAFYKKFNDKWLQCVDLSSQIASEVAFPYFKRQLYIDSLNQMKGYLLDLSGSKLDLELNLKQTSKGLTILSVQDLRGKKPGIRWKVISAGTVKGLDFLKDFENKEEIILWSKKNQLKKIEFTRYGLIFAVEQGNLKCLTEPYLGYTLNKPATTEKKQGIQHALLLEPPNPKKPKKLLVSDCRAFDPIPFKMNSNQGYQGYTEDDFELWKERGIIDFIDRIGFHEENFDIEWLDKSIQNPDIVEAKAQGFAKISLHFHKKKQKGRTSPIVVSAEPTIDRAPSHLAYTAFDLRPFTEEICKTNNWPRDILQLIQQANFTGDSKLALSYLNRFPMKAVLKDNDLLNELVGFLRNDGHEAAIKLKGSLKLINVLHAHHKLSPNLQSQLESIASQKGKQVLYEGRRGIPLTKKENIQLASILRKKDPEFYEKHLPGAFLKKGQILTNDTTAVDNKIDRWENTPLENETVDPLIRIPDDQLAVKIDRLSTKAPLLFTSSEVSLLFTETTKNLNPLILERRADEQPFETVALDTFQENLDRFQQTESTKTHYVLNRQKLKHFSKKQLLPKIAYHEARCAQLKKDIEVSLRTDIDLEKQVAIYSGESRPPTFEELRLSLIQGTLPAELEAKLLDYFDALTKKNAGEAALFLISQMGHQNSKEWNLMSDDLHRLLTIERSYDPQKNPRLLIFEAQLFLNFKDLPGGLNQLDLLESLISNPSTLVQAPTGAGKTSVLSVLESLLKSTGENLVIQKVLPPLYDQTHEKANEVIGDLFNTLVMPLRFNLKMPLKNKENSIFKGMYEDLQEVIKNKGCVLTDYTSFPLMEAKFLQLGQEFVECRRNGTQVSDIQREHFNYLRKILLLLENRGLESMDEFDQPNRPIQKFQLDLQLGSASIPSFFFETTLEIYALLAKNDQLGLFKNIQADISQETREEALREAASEMAKTFKVPKLADYFLGIDESVIDELNFSPEQLDKIALIKDQFTIYLPLSLNTKQGSRYARSPDGSRTVPCQNGQKHDAKFGTLQEQMNYTIQDYLQTGIHSYDLAKWFKTFKPEWDNADLELKKVLKNEFQQLFPDHSIGELTQAYKTKEGRDALIASVNQDPDKIWKFLTLQLQELKSSGYIISMDPVNIVNMSRAVSGISATSGAPDSLHKQFIIDRDAVGQIKASMAYRIQERASDSTVISYDPEHPEKMLETTYEAIIDGAGAFNKSTKQAAKDLLASNPELKQVGYHEENNITFTGTSTGVLSETGFVFDQAHTRGTDIALDPTAHVLLTLNKKGFRDFAQIEGRLRKEGQTYQLAMPQEQAADSLNQAITHSECIDAAIDAKDIYRYCRQEIPAVLRHAARSALLACEEIDDFVDLYEQEACNSLFITKPQKSYRELGSYFADRKHIQREDIKPEIALKDLYKRNKKQAERLGLPLDKISYSDELLKKMPPFVSAIQAELDCELQVEHEQEQEVEAELEMELELEQNHEMEQNIEEISKKSPYYIEYPPRVFSTLKASISDKIHPAYDPLLFVTEAFLPFERNKGAGPIAGVRAAMDIGKPAIQVMSLFKKLPFEKSMYNVGQVFIKVEQDKIVGATIEDPVYDYQMDNDNKGFIYDLRRGLVIRKTTDDAIDIDGLIQSGTFHKLTAQIKFFDGKTSGYSPEELSELEEWLIASDPIEMKRHLLQEVLYYRYRDKAHFENSQLGALFNDLI